MPIVKKKVGRLYILLKQTLKKMCPTKFYSKSFKTFILEYLPKTS